MVGGLKKDLVTPVNRSISKGRPSEYSFYDIYLSGLFPEVLFQRSAKTYDTSGQRLYNEIEHPYDGEAAASYDAFLGGGSGVDVNDPVYVSASGSVPAYFQADAVTSFTQVANTSAMLNLGTTTVHTYYCLWVPPASYTGTNIFYRSGGFVNISPGFGLRFISPSLLLRIATADGTSSGNFDISAASAATWATTGYGFLAFTYDPATQNYKVYSNTVTPIATGTATGVKQTTASANVSIQTYTNFTNGTGLIEEGMINKILTDNEVSALVQYLETRYNINIV